MVEVLEFKGSHRAEERQAECEKIHKELGEKIATGKLVDFHVAMVYRDGSTGALWTSSEHIQLVIASLTLALHKAVSRLQSSPGDPDLP